MRIRMISISQVLPALLILAMAASTQAQTNSLNGFSTNGQRQTDNAPTSRYRFVPTQKKQVATSSSQQLDQRWLQFDRPAQAPIIQQTTRVAALMPARDLSTSPTRLNPTVDSSAFHSEAYDTPTALDNYDSPETTYFNPSASGNSVTQQSDADGSVPQPQSQSYQPQQVVQAPFAMTAEPCYVPMNHNFFGVDRSQCCDEWDGFVGCGGLKAYPGHYGQPFIVGCDPCEPPCGRCSKCLVEKHRNKKANSGGCKKCGEGCSDCTNGGKKACGIKKARAEKATPDCSCDSCTAKKGGLLGAWLK